MGRRVRESLNLPGILNHEEKVIGRQIRFFEPNKWAWNRHKYVFLFSYSLLTEGKFIVICEVETRSGEINGKKWFPFLRERIPIVIQLWNHGCKCKKAYCDLIKQGTYTWGVNNSHSTFGSTDYIVRALCYATCDGT